MVTSRPCCRNKPSWAATRSGALSIPGTTATVSGTVGPDEPEPEPEQADARASTGRTASTMREAELRTPARASRIGPPGWSGQGLSGPTVAPEPTPVRPD